MAQQPTSDKEAAQSAHQETQEQAPKTAPKAIILRPALYRELPIAHALLMEAISTSPFYVEAFKQSEMQTFSPHFLERLHLTNPSHILLCTIDETIAGCMISSPDHGAVWLHWSYMKPEFRQGANALKAMRAFVEHFDNGQFHKIATYTKTGNDVAAAIMKRYGYKHIVTLEKHIFGEDYLLYERPLTKITEGYDNGVMAEGRFGRLKRQIMRVFEL
jgi:RimJ/RimL family protein N-acetyltransferase